MTWWLCGTWGGEAAACTVMEAVPDLVESSVLVAVTVIVAAAEGAVNRPVALMLPPPVADHVTAELKPPLPWTVALHCEVAPVATVVGVHEGTTEEMAGEEAWTCVGADLSPQEISAGMNSVVTRREARRFKGRCPSRSGCSL